MNYKNLNDYEIYYMIKENDDTSLELMFKKYEPIMMKFCKKFYKKYKYNGINMDDLMQEARIGFMKALNGYDDEESLFYSYVCLCVERQLISYIRTFNTLKNYPLNFSLSDGFFNKKDIIDSVDVGDILMENEIFFQCKNLLKFDQSIVFELRYNNFSYNEISKLLDLPRSTIDGRMTLIRKKLRNDLNMII